MKNKKLMISLIGLALFAVTTILIFGLGKLIRNKPDAIFETKKTVEKKEPEDKPLTETKIDRSKVTGVVESFMDSFINSAPPEPNQSSLKLAVSLLSEGAKAEMNEPPTSGDLARLIGVQDFPDQGYEIGEIVYQGNAASGIKDGLAETKVTLKYSGGNILRIFQLSKVEDLWQIDGVKLPIDN